MTQIMVNAYKAVLVFLCCLQMTSNTIKIKSVSSLKRSWGSETKLRSQYEKTCTGKDDVWPSWSGPLNAKLDVLPSGTSGVHLKDCLGGVCFKGFGGS